MRCSSAGRRTAELCATARSWDRVPSAKATERASGKVLRPYLLQTEEDARMLRAIKNVPDWLLILLASKAITSIILLS